jgi:hypothetical protein
MATLSTREFQTYVTLLCGGSAAVLGAVAGLNYVVDPYLTHQWQTPRMEQLRPPREKLSAWGKTYAVASMKPQVVYIGNSRTELGLEPGYPVFSGKRVFNGALSGASLSDAIGMASHAAYFGPLETVVWGIDAPSFHMAVGNTDFDRALVADGPFYAAKRALLNLKRALTVDMTTDSIHLLTGKFGRVCRSSLVFRGQRDDACINDRIDGWGGTRAAIRPRLQEFVRGDGPEAAALSAFDASIARLCADRSRVRLYVNPTHAMMLDTLYWAGKWGPVEAWQQALAAMTARQRAAGCDIRLFDFSGFNSVTTEAIPQASGVNGMRYYWEASHYRANVGRMILGRMFGGTEAVPVDFGVELLPPMMDAHLAEQRRRRDQFHCDHPVETAMAKEVAAEPR